MDIGAGSRDLLGKLEGGCQKSLLRDMRSHQEVFKYLVTRLPLAEPVVRNVQCLHPEVKNQDAAQKSSQS